MSFSLKEERCCSSCGTTFLVPPSGVKRGYGIYCSWKCRFAKSIDEVFWSKVQKSEGCWLWKGCANRKGYGQFWFNKAMRPSHRMSWLLTYGSIPEGKFVLHHCDNPPCVNPLHLFLGNNQDNMDDMVRKGRSRGAPGERNAAAILNRQQAEEIRDKYSTGNFTQLELAHEYGVTRTTIGQVVRNATWKITLPFGETTK